MMSAGSGFTIARLLDCRFEGSLLRVAFWPVKKLPAKAGLAQGVGLASAKHHFFYTALQVQNSWIVR